MQNVTITTAEANTAAESFFRAYRNRPNIGASEIEMTDKVWEMYEQEASYRANSGDATTAAAWMEENEFDQDWVSTTFENADQSGEQLQNIVLHFRGDMAGDDMDNIIAEWDAANPERNSYQYNNNQLVLDWRNEAKKRLAGAWVNGADDILETLSTELEAENENA